MMKRYLIPILVLAGLVLACFSTKAGSCNSSVSQYNEVIPLMMGGPAVDPNSPRIPSVVPISCSFNSQEESLSFIFLFPMGDITISLTEASLGVVSTNGYSTSSCFVEIHVPGPGTYEITVVLESGSEYTGQFMYR